MNMNAQNFGEFLQHKREEKEITLRRMADMLSVSAPFLSDVEKGRRNSLDMDKLVLLKQILDLSDDEYQTMLKLPIFRSTLWIEIMYPLHFVQPVILMLVRQNGNVLWRS